MLSGIPRSLRRSRAHLADGRLYACDSEPGRHDERDRHERSLRDRVVLTEESDDHDGYLGHDASIIALPSAPLHRLHRPAKLAHARSLHARPRTPKKLYVREVLAEGSNQFGGIQITRRFTCGNEYLVAHLAFRIAPRKKSYGKSKKHALTYRERGSSSLRQFIQSFAVVAAFMLCWCLRRYMRT